MKARMLARMVVVTAMATTVLGVAAGVADARRPDLCAIHQQYFRWSVSNLRHATYSGNIPAVVAWLEEFAWAEHQVEIYCQRTLF
jgi:hypothetical protein